MTETPVVGLTQIRFGRCVSSFFPQFKWRMLCALGLWNENPQRCIVLQNGKSDELGLETETSEMSLTLSEMEKEVGGTSFSCF